MHSDFFGFIASSFAASFIMAAGIIKLPIKYGSDSTQGVQKVHRQRVPRIGGVAIFITILAASYYYRQEFTSLSFRYLIAAALPVFMGGIVEDFTKRVSALARLILSFSSAIIGFFLLNASIHRTGISQLDMLLASYPEIQILLTMIAVGGLCQSVNIIDGMNGIMLGYAIIALGFLFWASSLANLPQLGTVCLIFIGASLGVAVLNFPFGRIFAGDGGSYLIGFALAAISLMLIDQSPRISAVFPVALFFYPVAETLFSMIRRIKNGKSPAAPDSKHLHSLIHQLILYARPKLNPSLQNSAVAPCIWFWNIINGLVLVNYISSSNVQVAVLGCNIILYVLVYGLIRKKVKALQSK